MSLGEDLKKESKEYVTFYIWCLEVVNLHKIYFDIWYALHFYK